MVLLSSSFWSWLIWNRCLIFFLLWNELSCCLRFVLPSIEFVFHLISKCICLLSREFLASSRLAYKLFDLLPSDFILSCSNSLALGGRKFIQWRYWFIVYHPVSQAIANLIICSLDYCTSIAKSFPVISTCIGSSHVHLHYNLRCHNVVEDQKQNFWRVPVPPIFSEQDKLTQFFLLSSHDAIQYLWHKCIVILRQQNQQEETIISLLFGVPMQIFSLH